MSSSSTNNSGFGNVGPIATASDEQRRLFYESVVRQDPSDAEAVHYLANWYLSRQYYTNVSLHLLQTVLVINVFI